MNDQFEMASGSVAGREHRRAGRNNQDAVITRIGKKGLVAIVADGCSSGPKTELGAIFGAQLACGNLCALLPFINEPAALLEEVRARIIEGLKTLVGAIRPLSVGQYIEEHLLFTLVGAAITPEKSIFFSLGDGYIAINGERLPLGPFEGNMPPYVGYALTKSSIDPDELKFKIHRVMPTAELMSFLIGTDGVDDLAGAAEKQMPGKTDLVGPLDALWTEDRYFTNPFKLRQHLVLVNGGVKDMNTPGLLSDDTTLAIGRRKKAANV
jgi:hypothetical protein